MELYLELIDYITEPMIRNLLLNDKYYLEPQLIFQQDGTPPHILHLLGDVLSTLQQGHWRASWDPTKWHPRSPDLPALGFFLWGNLKSRI